MSYWHDLCECICSVIRRQQQEANSVLQSVAGQDVITSQGYSNIQEAFGLQPVVGSNSMSNTLFLTVLFVVLFVLFITSMGRGRKSHATPEKPNRRPPSNFFDPDTIH